MTKVPGKLQGTCSVCLRQMQLHGERPIRHGFAAIGVRHGQSGGYHTGPCAGTQFPHLGLSTEGTQWALDREQRFLENIRNSLLALETNPDLTWYPQRYGRRQDLARGVVVKHGTTADYATGAPSYDYLHRTRKAELKAQEHMAERAIAEYERVLATWAPEKYPTTGAPQKVETRHMATPRQNSRGDAWTGVLCRFTRKGYASDHLPKTEDASQVTCKRCRSTLGLPPL